MKKVLIVEDDNFIREAYVDIFSSEGYDVSVCKDGEEAWEVLKNKEYDAILLDILMPKMTGIDVLKKLKTHFEKKDFPIVVITNLAHDGVIAEAMELGAKGHIIKARLTPGEVVKMVEELLFKNKDSNS